MFGARELHIMLLCTAVFMEMLRAPLASIGVAFFFGKCVRYGLRKGDAHLGWVVYYKARVACGARVA